MTVKGYDPDLGLRSLNDLGFELAATFMGHVAFGALPRDYRAAVEALHEATQDIFTEGESVLDFGREDGTGSTEMRASDLEVFDVMMEEGMEPVFVTKVDFHGDSVLITGEIGDNYGAERTLDRDTVVSVWRKEN